MFFFCFYFFPPFLLLLPTLFLLPLRLFFQALTYERVEHGADWSFAFSSLLFLLLYICIVGDSSFLEGLRLEGLGTFFTTLT